METYSKHGNIWKYWKDWTNIEKCKQKLEIMESIENIEQKDGTSWNIWKHTDKQWQKPINVKYAQNQLEKHNKNNEIT